MKHVRDVLKVDKNKIYNIILTTHSPFMLSDLPKEYIEFLEEDNNGNITLKEQKNMQNTFAGNIGEMFYNNFFMTEIIGEFAKTKLKDCLMQLETKISKGKQEKIVEIFNMVGDELLRKLLLDKLKY